MGHHRAGLRPAGEEDSVSRHHLGLAGGVLVAGALLAAVTFAQAPKTFDPRDLSGKWARTSFNQGFSTVPESGRGNAPQSVRMNSSVPPCVSGQPVRYTCRMRTGLFAGALPASVSLINECMP